MYGYLEFAQVDRRKFKPENLFQHFIITYLTHLKGYKELYNEQLDSHPRDKN